MKRSFLAVLLIASCGEKRAPVAPPPPPASATVLASVHGMIVDSSGRPVAGVKVSVRLKSVTASGETDEKGVFVVNDIPISRADSNAKLSFEARCHITVTKSIALRDSENPEYITLDVGTITLTTLEPPLPPGKLRGVARSRTTGRPLVGATIEISPGDLHATSAADGTFSIEVPPGQYKVTLTAPGEPTQVFDATVNPSGTEVHAYGNAPPQPYAPCLKP